MPCDGWKVFPGSPVDIVIGDHANMNNTESTSFVPLLTVMVDYGNAPFLWLVNSPDEHGVGGNLCDGTYWDASFPMPEDLWQKFADRAIEFDRTAFYSDNFDANDWDWIAFHARGLQLAHWLKEEVGDAYRIVYKKPYEDPNHCFAERIEILVNGEVVQLLSQCGPFPGPFHFCQRIVSGGQTGADRAALDFAIKHGYTHGGWAPCGRKAEDGIIPLKYQLTVLPEGGYRQRARRNVEDSDGTLIVNLGELDGGTLETQTFAQRLGKPHLVVHLDSGVSVETETSVVAWLRQNAISTLNVAGPRESKRPGIYQATLAFLERLDDIFADEHIERLNP